MTDQVSRGAGRPTVRKGERDITETSTPRFRPGPEADPSGGARTLDVYDEGLERHFELSSRLAILRTRGKDGNEEYETIEDELAELDRELSEMSRELSLSEIGALLRNPRDDRR